jgi:CubicO group peptidase (beta-lactamase class C family)
MKNYRSQKVRIFAITMILCICSALAHAQNRKGQLESDKFWEDYSKGHEWLTTSKSIPATTSSKLEVADNSLASSLSPMVNQAFDPDVHRIVILSHKRKIIHRKYNDRWVTEKSRPSSSSMAKSLTGLAVGKALCTGAIKSLDDEASIYSPRLSGTSWGKSKIRHLLAMSSGSNKPIFSPTGSPTPEVLAETLEKSYEGRMTKDFIDLMKKADQHYSASGQQGYYNNLDTEALAILVEDATRQKFIDFFAKEIWQTSGAAQSAKWSHNSLGQVAAFSGFTAHPYDWIRVGHYVLEERSKNTCFGNFLKEGTQQQSRVILPNGDAPYGFQMWLGCGGTNSFCFAGHGGQRLVMDPSTGFVMYVHATSDLSVTPIYKMYRDVLGQIKNQTTNSN